ncbi:ABC transporter substrate-binding protein [Phytomonospora endophytica]|uniref:Iron complex transport system substrate-binding protein n=1 Tax=Phytomonospora endophytica TaxID=714109 RepID=A0A841FLJ4_9ACTN|nr:iron-siderophore ABC transporter substrate-binding protein [Phytomonospora endophytica]MBB6032820.1 iron complex transport system substrate-binding protein [Phytomonospora endophytica]GIG66031.1 ferrichrome ABC transporter substrate-binding protein [Phytomonospora endophytica]
MRKFLGAFAVAALALGLAACSGKTADGGGQNDDKGGAITLTTTSGEVSLDKPAVKVVALEWTYVEDLLAIGVTPVGVADIKGYDTWVTAGARVPAGVKDVGTRQEPSIEEIRLLDPDLIVTDEDRVATNRDALAEIAPLATYSYTKDPEGQYAGMRRIVQQMGLATGKTAEAEQVLTDLDTKVATATEAVTAKGKTGAPFALSQIFTTNGTPQFRMMTEKSLAGEVVGKIGVANTWTGEPDAWGMTTVTVEGLTAVPGESSFLYVAADADNPVTGALADNKLWTDLGFVKDGGVKALDPGTWFFGGPLSCGQILDETVKALTA